MSSGNTPKYRPATTLVHGGTERTQWGETSEALILTSGYMYDSAEQAQARMAGDLPGYVYSRYNNPTVSMLEERLRLMEGAEACRAMASGMGAMSSLLTAPIQQGDRVVGASALFGSCRWLLANQLPKYGVETEFVDGMDMEGWKRALSKPTKLVLVESPANPLLDAVDIAAVAELAHEAGAQLIVDNVFATSLLQRPFELGADWVFYSATKHMDGGGRVLAGAIMGPQKDMEEIIDPYIRHTGPSISPFNAWVVLKGLESMPLRVAKQSESAAILADRMADHKALAAIRYPGREDHPHYEVHAKQMSSGGTMMAISLAGGQEAAFKFLNALNLVGISNNLGDAKSLACHPSSTTHRALSEEEQASMGLDGSWIRVSIGLEDVEDLSEDLLYALDVAAGA
ncbi:O-succinylhomoserine sulfhydrylase [Ponticaulis sp.]|uniref:O-succinylhomoserine sulfhydrylase n=1 Tax=Ponticaulis sp. TaxID=2020902 RepID=UPI000B6262E6|nr:O-succinylhomoserine sulfhydrylase [Ponticaulis sp.]MAI89989.1 O-succinylhomoserine sulfhydrylase [Ponticaulis sp.]OUX99651.1 MAG: O-succinylhomoserine sulfhydrylase [Hyphomonadaceae bacterium TMED5]|tara:strand:+ start:17928 stop:19127 length:1200 start_codon:yes stop_codon:yes gene_type:complete